MSVELVFDPETEDETAFALATNTGWQDTCRWISTLAREAFPGLHRLCEDGWATDIDRLREEIGSAFLVLSPSGDVSDTIDVLSRLLADVEPEAIIAVDQ